MFSAPETPNVAGAKPARRSTYQEAEPLPFVNGFVRLAPKWITDRFNDHWSNGSQTGQAYCSIAGLLCHGPIDHVRGIFSGGEGIQILDLSRSDDPDGPNYYYGSFEFGGPDKQFGATWRGRIYWGREDQPADAWLRTTTGQLHPAYPGQAYVIFERIHCGQIQANSNARPPIPAVEFSLIRLPSPSLPEGLRIPSTLTDDRYRGVNAVSALYDLLTHQRGGLGLVDALDTADWIAKAQALEDGSKAAGGAYGPQLWISPVHSGQEEAEKIVDDYRQYIDAFLYTHEGKLRIDWFPNDGVTPTGLPEITHHDLVEVLEMQTETYAETPTQIVVSGLEALPGDGPDLADAAETERVPFVREITDGENRVEKIDRPWFTYRDTLKAYAGRVAATRTIPAQRGRFVALESRAVRNDGSPLRPGDVVLLNWQPQQLLEVARITERMDGDSGAELSWERERGTTPLPYSPATDPRSDYTLPTPTKPATTDWTVLPAPSGLAGIGAVVFCRRAQNTLSGLRVHFDPVGDWGAASTQLGEQGFAVRVALGAGISDSATSATITSTDTDASSVLGSGANSTEQENDALILVFGDEWTSVGAVTSTAPDTYSVDLSRARLGSTAAAHSSGAYGWLIRRERLVVWENALFIDGDVGHFKVQTYQPLEDSPLSDEKTITFVDNPGWSIVNGYTITLSSYAHQVACSADGTVAAGQLGASGTAKTIVSVAQGNTLLTPVASAPIKGQFSVSVTSVDQATATKESNTTVRADTLTADSGSITLDIDIAGLFTVQKTYSLAKTKPGSNAKLVVLTSSAQTFQFAKDGSVTPGAITFTATGQNLTGSPTFSVFVGTVSGAGLSGAGTTRSLIYSDMATDAVTVKVVWDGQEDYISVVKVREGTDSIVAFLTNESHTVPADKDGNVSSFSGAATTMKIFRGIADDTSNWTIAKTESNLTGTLVSNVYTASAMAADVAYVDLTASRSGFSDVTKRFTVTKSKTGATGAGGSQGIPGPGLVYVGAYSAGTVYYCTTSRVDVVSYSGSYYRTNNTSKSGLTTWGTPGGGDWSAADATYKFVATDLLLANNQTITKTLVMGDGSTTDAGIIRSAGATAYGTGTGYWLNPRNSSGNAEFRVGNPSGSNPFLGFNGSNLTARFGAANTQTVINSNTFFWGDDTFANGAFSLTKSGDLLELLVQGKNSGQVDFQANNDASILVRGGGIGSNQMSYDTSDGYLVFRGGGIKKLTSDGWTVALNDGSNTIAFKYDGQFKVKIGVTEFVIF